MATHSCVLAWEILWSEEPGRLQSMGSQRVRHDLVTKQQISKVNELSFSNENYKKETVCKNDQNKGVLVRTGGGGSKICVSGSSCLSYDCSPGSSLRSP